MSLIRLRPRLIAGGGTLDIHKPKPWHGVREFLKEYLIIVMGVLTALAGEQAVESLHRREQAEIAERAMRLELGEDNGPQAYGRVVIAHCLDDRLVQIHDGAAAASADDLRKWVSSYVPPVRTWDSEAWKAVSASDAGKIMGADKLIAWSAAYRAVPKLDDTNHREAGLAAELRDALPVSGEVSAADRENLRRLASQLRFTNIWLARGSQVFLARTRRLGAGVPLAAQQTLLTQAKAIYGDCAVAPDFNAPVAAQDQTANLRGFAGWARATQSATP